MGKRKKKLSNFFQFFLWSKWPYYEDFMVKISIDIKMCNLWPYKNYYYKSKYPIVLLQESCEILQFKSGHLVWSGTGISQIYSPNTNWESAVEGRPAKNWGNYMWNASSLYRELAFHRKFPQLSTERQLLFWNPWGNFPVKCQFPI